MGRTLVIGDPHFREGCVREMEIFTEEVLRLVREHLSEIEFVVVLGDIMDRHGILHQKPFHQSCKFLLDLAALKKTYCLIGNHDFDIPSKYLPENHPYKVLIWNRVENLVIVEKPLIENNLLFCPYVPPGEFSRAVSEALGQVLVSETQTPWEALKSAGVGMVFAHQEFLGCQMGRLKSEVGDPWSMEPFGNHPFVVSGHIHDYQWVGENILYTGTPIQVNYGEGQKRGVCLLDVEFADTGLPLTHSETWLEIRMPKKIVKTLPLESLEAWVSKRVEFLLSRYSLVFETPKESLLKKKKTKKRVSEKEEKESETKLEKEFGTNSEDKREFDFILGLHARKSSDLIGVLRERVQEDRFLDRVRLQILVTRDRQTTAKGLVAKLRDLPLGLQGIFTNEVVENSVKKGGEKEVGANSEKEIEEKTWLQILEERVEGDEPGKRILNEVLKDLLQNG